MSEPIVLTKRNDEEAHRREEYMPEVTLEHDDKRHELYVNLGEEAGGMIESVSSSTFEAIRDRVLTDDDAQVLLAAVMGDHMDQAKLNAATTKLDRIVHGGGEP